VTTSIDTRCRFQGHAPSRTFSGRLTLAAGGLAAAIAFAFGGGQAAAQILDRNGQLVYPEGMAVPKGLSEVERQHLTRNPITGQLGRGVTPPPTGPVHCAAEYEPMEAIILSWRGSTAQQAVLAQMARQISLHGDADVVVAVASAAVQTSAASTIQATGADMSRIKFVVRNTDTIWIRDYGPRYIYEGNCRAIADHQYNRPRPNDNTFPAFYANLRGHAFYEIGIGTQQLVHGGGNYHLGALGRGYATVLIHNENPGFTQSQIIGLWQSYQNVNTMLTPAYLASIDSTQHIDMWMQIIGDNRVVLSTWPLNPGSHQAGVVDTMAAQMAGNGYDVFRVPAFSIGGVHYTYTNVVMCNDIVLIPMYSNTTVAPYNAQALAVWQQALPNKQIIQVNSDALVTSAGVMHCVMMHVPRHRGAGNGTHPTAYLRRPRGGEALQPGSIFQLGWISDDDIGVTSVELRLSTDGGMTYPTLIAGNLPRTGAFNWVVPPIDTSRARIRVIAVDADSNSGHDQSANFTIGEPCYANCDQSTVPPVLNVDDFLCFINEFAIAQGLPAAEQTVHYANCDGSTAQPVLNVDDFLCFINQYALGCP
jgi:agmatine deiminase